MYTFTQLKIIEQRLAVRMDTEKLKSNIYVGRTAGSFAELCRLVGEEPTKGNSREAQKRRLRRYFDWTEADAGNALTVTEVYGEAKPELLRADDKYSADILTCLQWDWGNARLDAPEEGAKAYSLSRLLTLCGFVREWWATDGGKAREKLLEFQREGTPRSSRHQIFNFANKLDLHIRQYCVTSLDRSLSRLREKGYLRTSRKSLWVLPADEKEFRRSTPEEERACGEIRDSVMQSLGVTILNLYNSAKYYEKYNRGIRDKLGLRSSLLFREVSPREPFDPVSEDDYEAARRRINQKSAAKFREFASTDLEKDVERCDRSVREQADEDTLWLLETFEYTPKNLYEMNYGSTEESLELKEALASWFVEMDGAKSYIEKGREIVSRQHIGQGSSS